MDTAIIKLKKINKVYSQYKYEWQRVLSWCGLPFKASSENWCLRDIDLEIFKGESIGIIGSNGAGKSTLLKIISQSILPNSGYVEVNGTISSILELGIGLEFEYSGRENAYHVLGLMGYSNSQVSAVLEQIIEFSELSPNFDNPVRTYSTGMVTRLAFSIATAFKPDILILDEVLSVGDREFQAKSFNRILEFRKRGTTLIAVSHVESSITDLCHRFLKMENGKLRED